MIARTPHLGFILYDNRSGSTLLSALLDRYRSISVSPETNRVGEILEAASAAGRPAQEGHDRGPSEVREQLLRVVDEVCDAGDEITHQLIKGPRFHFHLAALPEAIPGCVFIQIVRDGRAVFASKRRTPSPSGGMMDDNLLHAAWNWRRKLEIAAPLGEQLLTIRYEDLARHPEATVQRALDFLGVEPGRRQPDRGIGDFFRDKIPATHRYLHAGLEEPVATGSIDAWSRQLAPHEVLLYEMKNAASLEQHGYPVERHGTRQPLGVFLRAYSLYLTSVARWGLRVASATLRSSLTPGILMRKIRRTHGEVKARRSARAARR